MAFSRLDLPMVRTAACSVQRRVHDGGVRPRVCGSIHRLPSLETISPPLETISLALETISPALETVGKKAADSVQIVIECIGPQLVSELECAGNACFFSFRTRDIIGERAPATGSHREESFGGFGILLEYRSEFLPQIDSVGIGIRSQPDRYGISVLHPDGP